MLSLVSGFELVATRMLLLVSFFTSDAKHSQLVYKNLRPKNLNVLEECWLADLAHIAGAVRADQAMLRRAVAAYDAEL